MTYVVPQAAPENNLCVYNSDITTLERAIKERVFFVKINDEWTAPPPTTDAIWNERLEPFFNRLVRHLPSTTPVTHEQFVGFYRGRKRVVYQKALESLQITGISRRDFRIKAFVKAEKGKPGSAPRVIQPRDPRCNVEIGVYLKPIEEQVYEAIGKVYGEPTVMKGYNAKGVARHLRTKWARFKKPIAIPLDAHRFDQHVRQSALKWEHRVYLECFLRKHRAKLAWLLRNQLVNKGTGYCSDGKLKYTVQGGRMSGDMNTALGNCLDMCALIWAYAQFKGIDISLVNNGDDCSVIMEACFEQHFLHGLPAWFEAMGFTMTVDKTARCFEHIEFCQAHPIFDGHEWVMVRNLRAFTKDAMSLIPVQTAPTLKYWLGAVGDAGMHLTGGIPIWQEYYAWYQRSAGDLSSKRKRRGAVRMYDQSAFETGMMMMAKGMTRRYGEVAPEARLSFWLATGIIPDHQIALEKQYASLAGIIPPNPEDKGFEIPLPHQGFTTAY